MSQSLTYFHTKAYLNQWLNTHNDCDSERSKTEQTHLTAPELKPINIQTVCRSHFPAMFSAGFLVAEFGISISNQSPKWFSLTLWLSFETRRDIQMNHNEDDKMRQLE